MTGDTLLQGYAVAHKAAKEADSRCALCLDDQGRSPEEISAEGSMNALEEWALRRPFQSLADALPLAAILSTRRNGQMFDEGDIRFLDDGEGKLLMGLVNGLMALAEGELAVR
jgi:hypothetical protein